METVITKNQCAENLIFRLNETESKQGLNAFVYGFMDTIRRNTTLAELIPDLVMTKGNMTLQVASDYKCTVVSRVVYLLFILICCSFITLYKRT